MHHLPVVGGGRPAPSGREPWRFTPEGAGIGDARPPWVDRQLGEDAGVDDRTLQPAL